MLWLFLFIVSIFMSVFGRKLVKRENFADHEMKYVFYKNGLTILCLIIALFSAMATSYVVVDGNKVGHMARVYLARSIPSGRILAMPGEMGPQAEILMPGLQIRPFLTVLYKIEELDVLKVPENHYAILTAKDGRPLRDGQFIADPWSEDEYELYQDALYFMGYDKKSKGLSIPRGQKGPQLTVLTPGSYRLNHYLFTWTIERAVDIPAGFVGVVKSNVGNNYNGNPYIPQQVMNAYMAEGYTEDRIYSTLAVPIVPKGYVGIWKDVLLPNAYYLNKMAYEVTIIDTRTQTWKYIGGYKRRWIDLTISQEGKIEQHVREEEISVPNDAADEAIVIRVEDWDVFLDSRVLVQVTPENAPYVVATVGGIQEVEDKIITPVYRSEVRNVVGARDKKVLSLLYERKDLEGQVESDIMPEGLKAGVTISEVKFGDPLPPPELLIPGKRRQLATELTKTYMEEQSAQSQRILTESARAEADQQPKLMEAEIKKKAAELIKEEQKLLGEGEEAKKKAVARGEKALLDVLGAERTFELAKLEKVLSAVIQSPDIVKIPNILVLGDERGGFSGPAAILGASNLFFGLDDKAPTGSVATKGAKK